LRFFRRKTPVPLGRIRLLRKISIGTDSLFPPYESMKHRGSMLHNEVLGRALADDELGIWSMCPTTLNFIESEIQSRKPNLVLELGSGLSTICLAQYMYDQYGSSDRIYVCSVEQDAEVIKSTLDRLRAFGLAQHVRIFHAPLLEQTIEGHRGPCYSLPAEFVSAMKRLQPDFVVIDGPSAEPGARFGTLPLIQAYLRRTARFYLDDALRDGELTAAARWSRLPYVRLDGIYLTQKGLLLGEVQGR
jgi:predicted O-methyltransferase YrrM